MSRWTVLGWLGIVVVVAVTGQVTGPGNELSISQVLALQHNGYSHSIEGLDTGTQDFRLTIRAPLVRKANQRQFLMIAREWSDTMVEPTVGCSCATIPMDYTRFSLTDTKTWLNTALPNNSPMLVPGTYSRSQLQGLWDPEPLPGASEWPHYMAPYDSSFTCPADASARVAAFEMIDYVELLDELALDANGDPEPFQPVDLFGNPLGDGQADTIVYHLKINLASLLHHCHNGPIQPNGDVFDNDRGLWRVTDTIEESVTYRFDVSVMVTGGNNVDSLIVHQVPCEPKIFLDQAADGDGRNPIISFSQTMVSCSRSMEATVYSMPRPHYINTATVSGQEIQEVKLSMAWSLTYRAQDLSLRVGPRVQQNGAIWELLADILDSNALDITFTADQIACYGLHVVGVEPDPRPAAFVAGETTDFLVEDIGSSPTTYSPVWCKNDRCRFIIRVETGYFPFHPGTEDGSLFHGCPADPTNVPLATAAATQFGFSIKPHRCPRLTSGTAFGSIENPFSSTCSRLCSEAGPANVKYDELVATLVKDVFPRTTQVLQMRVQSIPHVNPAMYTALEATLTGAMPVGVVASPTARRVADESERVSAMTFVRGGACAALTADMEAAFLTPDGVTGDTTPDNIPCLGNSLGAPDAEVDLSSAETSNMCLTYYSQYYSNWPDPTTADGQQRTRVYIDPDSLEIEPVGWTSSGPASPQVIKKSTTAPNAISDQFSGSTTTWNDFIGLMTRVSRVVKRGTYADGQLAYTPTFPTKPTLPYVFSGPSEEDEDLDLRVTDGFCFNAGAMVDFYTDSFVPSGSGDGGTFTGFRVKAKVKTMINDPTAGRRLLQINSGPIGQDEVQVETVIMIPDGDSSQTCRDCIHLQADEVVVPKNVEDHTHSDDDDEASAVSFFLLFIIVLIVSFFMVALCGTTIYCRRNVGLEPGPSVPKAGRRHKKSKTKGRGAYSTI